MKKHKWLIFILILFFSFPIICHASTYLVASTQKPIQSNNFYIRLAIDYGDSLLIKEAHYKITYDPTLFKFVSLQWTQARGNYDCDDNGTIATIKAMFNEYNYLCDTHTCGLYYRFYCSVL
jgi:threonine synthase